MIRIFDFRHFKSSTAQSSHETQDLFYRQYCHDNSSGHELWVFCHHPPAVAHNMPAIQSQHFVETDVIKISRRDTVKATCHITSVHSGVGVILSTSCWNLRTASLAFVSCWSSFDPSQQPAYECAIFVSVSKHVRLCSASQWVSVVQRHIVDHFRNNFYTLQNPTKSVKAHTEWQNETQRINLMNSHRSIILIHDNNIRNPTRTIIHRPHWQVLKEKKNEILLLWKAVTVNSGVPNSREHLQKKHYSVDGQL